MKKKQELLEKLLEEAVSEKEFAGVNLLWVRNGEEVCHFEKGMADLEEARPMTRDTIFRLYSQSKPVTSAAAMKLIQDGRIDLYDPVAKFFPSFAHQKVQTMQGPVPALHQMTIRDLLNMTSGLVYPDCRTRAEADTAAVFTDLLNGLGTDHAMSTAEFADRLGNCTLQFEPGTNWQYGTSADIMGAVIEKAADMPMASSLQNTSSSPSA